MEVSTHEQFVNMMDSEEEKVDLTESDPGFLCSKLNGFTFDHMRNLGQHECGHDKNVGKRDQVGGHS